MAKDFYEQIALDYERMTDERARLGREVPFLVEEIKRIDGREVLDIGCGTGAHALSLAAAGFEVLGIDTSPAMIERALAADRVEGAHFEIASLADIADRAVGRFDAVICLGNTLPHLITGEVSLAKVSRQIAPLMRRGGLLIGQIVNVPWVESAGVRLLPVRSWTEENKEIILTRHYINTGGSTLLLLFSRLARRPDETSWNVETASQQLRKIVPMEVERAFDSGPWSSFRGYGGWDRERLDDSCPSMIFVAARR